MENKTKNLIVLVSVLTFILSTSCNKEGCTDETATNYSSKAKTDDGSCTYPDAQPTVATVSTTTFIVNDTVDFSTTTNDYEFSVRLTRTGIDTSSSASTVSFFTIVSRDSNTVSFIPTPNRILEFNAGYGAFLFTDYTNGNTQLLQAKKYNIDNMVDGSASGSSVVNGITSARILEDNIQSTFTQNSTQFLGLSFNDNNETYYGWVEIKTLNNNYSCIIVSYDVANEPNKPVVVK